MKLSAADWPIAASMLPFNAYQGDASRLDLRAFSEWKDHLREVREAGFQAIDLTDTWLPIGLLSDDSVHLLKEELVALGMTVPSISVIRRSVIDERNYEQNMEYSLRSLEAAKALGTAVVSVGLHQELTPAQNQVLWFWATPGYQDPPLPAPEFQLAADRLRQLGQRAQELGLLLSLEMYEDTYLGTADSAVQLVQAIGLENVGLNPDVGNLIRARGEIEPWETMFEKILPYTNFWHMKNYARDELVEQGFSVVFPVPMMLGLINYRKVFKLALAAGFQGVLCLENYGGDGLSICAENRRYLQDYILPKTQDYDLGASKVLQRHEQA